MPASRHRCTVLRSAGTRHLQRCSNIKQETLGSATARAMPRRHYAPRVVRTPHSLCSLCTAHVVAVPDSSDTITPQSTPGSLAARARRASARNVALSRASLLAPRQRSALLVHASSRSCNYSMREPPLDENECKSLFTRPTRSCLVRVLTTRRLSNRTVVNVSLTPPRAPHLQDPHVALDAPRSYMLVPHVRAAPTKA